MLMALLAGASLAAAQPPAPPAAQSAQQQPPQAQDPAAEALARRLVEVIGAGDEARARAFFD